MTTETSLKRSIGFKGLIFYGVGTMVGGGFFALMGKIAGDAGSYTPFAFLLAGLLALLNAFAFAEFSSRFPVSAGEARFVEEGLGNPLLGTFTGLLVAVTGIVSAATLAVATAGFVQDLGPIPAPISIISAVLLLGLVACWGIGESAIVVTIITIIEVGALILVMVLGTDDVYHAARSAEPSDFNLSAINWAGLLSGTFIGLYAFVGFEDMVNIAEEVEDPTRNLPRAILICVLFTTFIYIAVSLVAVSKLSPEQLKASHTPIAELIGKDNWFSHKAIVIISILTGLNGALVQIIMASRVFYGLAGRGQLPKALNWMAQIHAKTRTPLFGTLFICGVILLLALSLPLTKLAKVTSGIILAVFALVNLALWRYKGLLAKQEEREEEEANEVGETVCGATGHGLVIPRWLPMVGFISCLLMLLSQIA